VEVDIDQVLGSRVELNRNGNALQQGLAAGGKSHKLKVGHFPDYALGMEQPKCQLNVTARGPQHHRQRQPVHHQLQGVLAGHAVLGDLRAFLVELGNQQALLLGPS
jgi:hypothetical protein